MGLVRQSGEINLLVVDTNVLRTLASPTGVEFLTELSPRLRTVQAVARELDHSSHWVDLEDVQGLVLGNVIPLLRTAPDLLERARDVQQAVNVNDQRPHSGAPEYANWAESVLIARIAEAGPNDVLWTDDRSARKTARQRNIKCMSTLEVLVAFGASNNAKDRAWNIAQSLDREQHEIDRFTRKEFELLCDNSLWWLSPIVADEQQKETYGLVESPATELATFYPDADFLLRFVKAGTRSLPFIRALGPQLVITETALRHVAAMAPKGYQGSVVLNAMSENAVVGDVEPELIADITTQLLDAQFDDAHRVSLPLQGPDRLAELKADAEVIALAWRNDNGLPISFQPGRLVLLRSVQFTTCSPKAMTEVLMAARPELRHKLETAYLAAAQVGPVKFDRSYEAARNLGLSPQSFDTTRSLAPATFPAIPL